MGNHLSHDWRYIDKTKVWAAPDHTDARHLNAQWGPADVQAPTDFAYLTTDASPDAPYLKA